MPGSEPLLRNGSHLALVAARRSDAHQYLGASTRNYGHASIRADLVKGARSALSPEGINSLPNL